MSEATVQQYLIKKVKINGGLAVKVDCKSRRGWPDIIMIRPGREPALVEVKTDEGTGRLSSHQVSTHKEINGMGTPVWVVSTKDEVDSLLA